MKNSDFISKEEVAKSFVIVEKVEQATFLQHEARFCPVCRELVWKTHPYCPCDTRS